MNFNEEDTAQPSTEKTLPDDIKTFTLKNAKIKWWAGQDSHAHAKRMCDLNPGPPAPEAGHMQ